jgi:hypothetical protein
MQNKVFPLLAMKACGEMEVQILEFLTSDLDGNKLSSLLENKKKTLSVYWL